MGAMAARRIGTVVYKRDLSPILTIFRVAPEAGHAFPPSVAGQYIALGRNDVPRTKRAGDWPDGRPRYVPDVDDAGTQRIGQAVRAYTIASAPWEQEAYGYLEFYVVLVFDREGLSGRLSSVLLRMDSDNDRELTYVDRIVGTFTLAERTDGYDHVVMVGTGTGLAPFIAMVKQLHHDAVTGRRDDRRFTLIHANRTHEELAYHARLLEIERAQTLDFVYLPTVSRPAARERDTGLTGVGRANNVLRHVLGLPTAEEASLAAARAAGTGIDEAERAVARAQRPGLPRHLTAEGVRARMLPGRTMLLTCGNAQAMEDIEAAAREAGLEADKEEW